jgi:hypothetical protein
MTSRIRRHGALPGGLGRKAAVAEANTTDLYIAFAGNVPEKGMHQPSVKQAVLQRFARKLETEMTSTTLMACR